MVMRNVVFKTKGRGELKDQSLENRKIDRRYLKKSEMVFTLLIQHHEMCFH